MKKISTLIVALSFSLLSCSSDDGNSETDNPENPNIPTFAMTASIGGTVFQANNPFGNNQFSTTNIFNYYPIADFVLLQGRAGGVAGAKEINLWLKRSDIAVGTYAIGSENFDTPPSHFIDLIDNTNEISEYTKEGIVTITEVNTTTKIVKGTFEFKTVDQINDPQASVDFHVTEGKFRYVYE
jgi:hypothetical protein